MERTKAGAQLSQASARSALPEFHSLAAVERSVRFWKAINRDDNNLKATADVGG